MRASIFHGTRDIRVEEVPDAGLREPTDALVRVSRAAICGSDLWFYRGVSKWETVGRSPRGEVLSGTHFGPFLSRSRTTSQIRPLTRRTRMFFNYSRLNPEPTGQGPTTNSFRILRGSSSQA